MNISAKRTGKADQRIAATVSMFQPTNKPLTRGKLVLNRRQYIMRRKNEASGAFLPHYSSWSIIRTLERLLPHAVFLPADRRISYRMHPPGLCASYSSIYETMDIDSQLDVLRAVDCEGILLSCNQMAPSDFLQVPRFFLFRSLS